MLQQTQAPRVVPKFNDFVKQFPTFTQLAEADNQSILQLWSGLGYNRRALWLKELCITVSKKNHFPKDPEELIKFKGIGPYTARSIPIFAFNLNIATVDTNIKQILVEKGFAKLSNSENELFGIARQILPLGKSRDWHNALMDYGSHSDFRTKRKMKTKTKTKGRTKKSKQFINSSRDYRGRIIRHLTSQKFASKADLLNLNIPTEQFDLIIDKLVKDKLVTINERKYFL